MVKKILAICFSNGKTLFADYDDVLERDLCYDTCVVFKDIHGIEYTVFTDHVMYSYIKEVNEQEYHNLLMWSTK